MSEDKTGERALVEAQERLRRDCETDGFTLPNSEAWKAHVADLRTVLSFLERAHVG